FAQHMVELFEVEGPAAVWDELRDAAKLAPAPLPEIVTPAAPFAVASDFEGALQSAMITLKTCAYRVRARDVVPGMLVQGQAVTRVWRDADDPPDMVRGKLGDGHLGGFKFRADTLVEVQLPGPSPRELCCTCSTEWSTLEQHARLTPCSVTEAARAFKTRTPHDHASTCPVAPTARHGGMRLWPVGATSYDAKWQQYVFEDGPAIDVDCWLREWPDLVEGGAGDYVLHR